MAMLCSEHLESTEIAGLAGVAETNVLGTLHVGGDKRCDRAWCNLNNSIANRFGLTEERDLIRGYEFRTCGIVGQADALPLTASKRQVSVAFDMIAFNVGRQP